MPSHIIKVVRELRQAAAYMRNCGLESNAVAVFARANKIVKFYEMQT